MHKYQLYIGSELHSSTFTRCILTCAIADRLGASARKLEDASSRVRFRKSLSTKCATLHSLAIACMWQATVSFKLFEKHSEQEEGSANAESLWRDVTEYALPIR